MYFSNHTILYLVFSYPNLFYFFSYIAQADLELMILQP
jgi:hypothetical protein